MESKPNLARDWWEAALALVSAVFVARSFFSLIAVLRPVPPTLEEDAAYLAVIATGSSILAYLAAKRFAFAARLRPYAPRLLYVAFGAGVLLAIWMSAVFPARVAANKAYAGDSVCGVVGAADAASALCHTTSGRAVAAWYDRNTNTYSLSILVGTEVQNVELRCPGDHLFTSTVGAVRNVRVDFFGSRIATVAASGLMCATTFAPSAERTLGLIANAAFGLAIAAYSAWVLWGDRISAWPLLRRGSKVAAKPTLPDRL